jgi:hypothetical protein
MKEELDALFKTWTWDLVDFPAEQYIIVSEWMYKIKTHSNGSIDCYKDRSVVK